MRSHSSVDQLKSALAAHEAICGKREPAATTTTKLPPPEYNLLRRKTPPIVRRAYSRISRVIRPLKTYTAILYNDDPLAVSRWRLFLVPDAEMSDAMRTAFERAHGSDDMCNCRGLDGVCIEHAPLDMNSKFEAVRLLDTNILTTSDPNVRKMFKRIRIPLPGASGAAVSNTTETLATGVLARYEDMRGERALSTENISTTYKFRIFI